MLASAVAAAPSGMPDAGMQADAEEISGKQADGREDQAQDAERGESDKEDG